MKKQVIKAFVSIWIMLISVVLFMDTMPIVSATGSSIDMEESIESVQESEQMEQEQESEQKSSELQEIEVQETEARESEQAETIVEESEQSESISQSSVEESELLQNTEGESAQKESIQNESTQNESTQNESGSEENRESLSEEITEEIIEETIGREESELETEYSTLEDIQEAEETEETEETTETQEIEEMRPFVMSRNANISGKITLDGELVDWKNVSAQASSDGYIEEWKVATDEDETLFFCFTGTATSEWDSGYQWKTLSITQNGKTETRQMSGDWSWKALGASIVCQNNAHGNSAADYVVEMSMPASYFTDENYSITFAGTTISASDIAVLDGVDVSGGTGEEEETPVYDGIVMDGDFSDWDAVKKVEISCPNDAHPHCIILAAAVFDGDYVYLYIKDGEDGNASGAGTHSNGKYAIVTDLGHELLFQLNANGTVSGVDGALVQHIGAQWEIAIPQSALPYYKQSIAFGLYQTESFISDLVNLQGGEGNLPDSGELPDVDENGFICDGSFAEWIDYPHARITYATAGTGETVVDAEGALYAVGSGLFGHVVTMMPAHLAQAGGEFTRGITIRFNQEQSMVFYPRLVSVDDAGNIDWNTQLSDFDTGTYEFYLTSIDAWGTSANISEVNQADTIYGKMTIAINGTCDEMEFFLDLEKIAKKLGCDVSDFKVIDGHFSQIGHEWITTAGASSGAWLGLFICLVVVWLYFLHAFSEAELYAWRFLWGSMGLFVMAMLFIQPYLTQPLSQCVTALAGILGELTGAFEAYFKYGIIFIHTNVGAMTLQIDFECSGIIEIMAFGSLLAFFRVYKPSEKLMIAIGGFAYIMICNAIRIAMICLAVHVFGTQAYYVMHTFVGRIFFYILSVIMYFYVFTKPHIIQMKVGNFTYGHRQAIG